MLRFIFLFFISCALFTAIACDNCRPHKCPPEGDYVNIRLMRNGKNAVFGPDAFIDRDSITYFDEAGLPLPPSFNDTAQTIQLYIQDPESYLLDLKSFGKDTLSGITSLLNFDGCCPTYKLVTVYWNDVEICVIDCREVIEVEI